MRPGVRSAHCWRNGNDRRPEDEPVRRWLVRENLTVNAVHSTTTESTHPAVPWPRVTLSKVCEVILGGTPKTGNPKYWGGGIPWLTPGEMGALKSRYVEHTTRTLTEAGLAAGSRLFPARSVILSTRAPIGYVFINTVPMCTNQGCKTLVPKDCIFPEYLYFNLLGRTEELNALGTGTTFKELATGRLQDLSLPLPPLSVQRDIVARLDAGLARADRMRERFLALAESASARFRAILAETFEQGENGDSWPRVKLGEIGRVVTGSTPSTSHKEYYGGKWPLFKPTDLDAGLEVVTASDSLTDAGWNCARRLPENAVLVTCIGATLGKTGIIRKKGTCNQQINAIVPEKAIPEFLYYALISPGFQKTLWRTSNATTLPIVNKARFETLSIPLPPMNIQRSIVARLDATRADCGRIEELARKGAEGCAALRAALLKEAFE